MNQIKLGLHTLPIPDKIQLGRRIAMAMADNPAFPAPNPPLDDVSASADALQTAYNDAQAARQTAKMKTAVQEGCAADLDRLLTQLASYVETAGNGDRATIESAGFTVRNRPTPVGPLPAPDGLEVLPSDHAGTADVSWQPVPGAKAYLVERAPDAPELDWAIIGSSTKKAVSMNSMESGKKYWFRVSALGTAGQSPGSNPVAIYAP